MYSDGPSPSGLLAGKQVVRPATAARLLDVSLSTFWRRARTDPSFPKPFKLGGPSSRTTVVDADELSRWVETQKCGTTPPEQA
jgi:predicted DNA-binding transcriptional regulator AlpA